MRNPKRFQSGREIFQEYIPQYKPDSLAEKDPSERATRLAEAILRDFSASLKDAIPSHRSR